MITKIISKLNGNPKTLQNREQLLKEIKTYKSLNSIHLSIEFSCGDIIELAILSAVYFILSGTIQSNILENKKIIKILEELI
jgi:hypothetical protein